MLHKKFRERVGENETKVNSEREEVVKEYYWNQWPNPISYNKCGKTKDNRHIFVIRICKSKTSNFEKKQINVMSKTPKANTIVLPPTTTRTEVGWVNLSEASLQKIFQKEHIQKLELIAEAKRQSTRKGEMKQDGESDTSSNSAE